jgi:GntR family transcriptional regulator / MocR family aminotransferase
VALLHAGSRPAPYVTPVVEAAARRGVAVYGLSPYRISRDGRPGLIFGYATLGERVLIEGIEILAEAISDVRSRDGRRPC